MSGSWRYASKKRVDDPARLAVPEAEAEKRVVAVVGIILARLPLKASWTSNGSWYGMGDSEMLKRTIKRDGEGKDKGRCGGA